MHVSNRTVRVLVIIGVILIAGWGIAQYSNARRTGKYLQDLSLQDPAKVMDALAELRSRGPSIGPRLTTMVQTAEGEEGARAAWLLGLVGSHAGDEALTQALGSEDQTLRLAALQSLGRLHVHSAEPAVTAILNNPEEKPGIRSTAVTTLGMFGTETAAGVMAQVLADRPKFVPPPPPGTPVDPNAPKPPPDTMLPLRLAAAKALGTMRQPAGLEPLALTLAPDTEQDNEVRVAAAYALGDLTAAMNKDEELSTGIRGLLDAANDKLGDVRVAAFYSLGKVSVPETLRTQVAETLKEAGEDKHYWARMAADNSRKSLRFIE